MTNKNKKLSSKVSEGITNLANLGVIPSDELQLNLDVIHESIASEYASVVEMESPNQIVSYFDISYGSPNKAQQTVKNGDEVSKRDAFQFAMMNGVGGVPLDTNGYQTDNVQCDIILNGENKFVAYFNNVLPGTVKINTKGNSATYADSMCDGNIININDGEVVGTVNYTTGLFSFNDATVDGATLSYKYDILNLENTRNKIQLHKKYVQVFANMHELDLDYATNLKDQKLLKFKDIVSNLTPQLLAQQIDHWNIVQLFKTASENIQKEWDSNISTVFNFQLAEDFGCVVSLVSAQYTQKHGVEPNIIICNPVSYGYLSSCRKFVPAKFIKDITKDEVVKHFTLPRVVGEYNNATVILDNGLEDYKADLVLSFKGESEAQATCIYTPYIPVQLLNRENVMEGMGLLSSLTAYSIGGFVITNPNMIEGIHIIE